MVLLIRQFSLFFNESSKRTISICPADATSNIVIDFCSSTDIACISVSQWENACFWIFIAPFNICNALKWVRFWSSLNWVWFGIWPRMKSSKTSFFLLPMHCAQDLPSASYWITTFLWWSRWPVYICFNVYVAWLSIGSILKDTWVKNSDSSKH